MIRSFFKKVFSSSAGTASTHADENRPDEAEERDRPRTGQEESTGPEADGEVEWETVTLTKEWLNPQSINRMEEIVERLYEEAGQSGGTSMKRLRLGLDPLLEVSPDSFWGKKLGKFLDDCEQQIIDLTFFLDKKDESTMSIYKTYLLPLPLPELHVFLRERCMMISETGAGLGLEYRTELEDYLQALNIAPDEEFFAEFERWREMVLKRHEEEVASFRETPAGRGPVVMLKISKEEVENENIQQIDQYMRDALLSPEKARACRETLLFSFYGFHEEDLLSLMNKKEINDWASLLVEKHPYIFYFLNDSEYPMSRFLTSLVVATEVEGDAVYYNEDELSAFRQYIEDALEKIARWLGEDELEVTGSFTRHFQGESR